jgi:probable rRNA maturation factor
MKIGVIILDKEAKKYEKDIGQKAKKLAKLFPKKGEIEVYLVSGRRMRRLNKRFRNKDKSTNVLSFQKPRNFPGSKLGEVYLDPLYIQKHKEDMDLMLVHGVLHILGYDHEKKSDRIKMEKREAGLLRRLK